MNKLFMLILCLLVTCNVFSQNDIQKNKYVFLTEDQAKAVIKDLIDYDALQQISDLQEKRISTFEEKEKLYKHTIKLKDSVILNQEKIINNKDEIIKKSKWLDFSSYIGVKSRNFDISTPIFYNRTFLEFKKVNAGIQFNFQPVESVYNNTFEYNLFVEFKIL